ncbi:hypothetical protein AK812_SmicGene22699 [Symbiodinium microadriaticum]|uniref:Uncharacterized protein n=1 Tax=Symbiodinium microadriaticum TaxID=2951 RepID=A0A1Q9DJ49_SYMMI|nr:hypothetical protein AK812_SmicGene22699 [Symbiodinium microadriaticum]
MDTGSLVHNASCGALDAHFLLQLAHQVFSAAHGYLLVEDDSGDNFNHQGSWFVVKSRVETFLETGAQKLVDDTSPFFSFARPQQRSEPPTDPAGIDGCSSKTLGRWKGDAHRLAPYQYADGSMVKIPRGGRRPVSKEQLRMLGFSSAHLDLKQKLTEDQRQQLIGNTETWSTVQSDKQKHQLLSSSSWQERFGADAGSELAAGCVRFRGRAPAATAASFIASLPTSWTDERLLVHLIAQSLTRRGTYVRLDNQAPMVASEFCRRTIDPTMWTWKVVMSHKWRRPGHITLLELVAVLDCAQATSANNRLAPFQCAGAD